jgi:hypothetical protein
MSAVQTLPSGSQIQINVCVYILALFCSGQSYRQIHNSLTDVTLDINKQAWIENIGAE